ncbi:MAG: hypothetical protein LBC77_01065 [Spirochaetaceae bacterium]|jgi:hypothetical protein|nr:hypothetical protein [Spirochaetaceae bacterium]
MPVFFSALTLLFFTGFRGTLADVLWPPSFPYGAFELASGSNNFNSITVNFDQQRLVLRKNTAGRFSAFPVYDGERFLEAAIEWNGGRIARLYGGGEDYVFDAEVLEYDEAGAYITPFLPDAPPKVVRLNLEGGYFFVSFTYFQGEVLETWFSEDGAAAGVYKIQFDGESGRWKRLEFNGDEGLYIARRDFDSFGGLSAETTSGRRSTVINGEKGARYIEVSNAEGGRFSAEIQRNALGLPVRAVEEIQGEDFQKTFLEYRYQFDSAGNWTERVETSYEERFGALVPAAARTVTRELEYRNLE